MKGDRINPLIRPRIVIIQARLESQRRSGKGLALIGKQSLLQHVAERALAIPKIDRYVIATTDREKDDEIVEHLRNRFDHLLHFERGSSVDVQSRFISAADKVGPCNIARITADDPFKDPALYSKGFDVLERFGADYASIGNPLLPLGLDIEVFTSESLAKSRRLFPSLENQEHVTFELVRQPEFRKSFVPIEGLNQSQGRLTVDYEEDIAFTSRVAMEIDSLGGDFSYQTTLTALATVEEQDRRANA